MTSRQAMLLVALGLWGAVAILMVVGLAIDGSAAWRWIVLASAVGAWAATWWDLSYGRSDR